MVISDPPGRCPLCSETGPQMEETGCGFHHPFVTRARGMTPGFARRVTQWEQIEAPIGWVLMVPGLIGLVCAMVIGSVAGCIATLAIFAIGLVSACRVLPSDQTTRAARLRCEEIENGIRMNQRQEQMEREMIIAEIVADTGLGLGEMMWQDAETLR